LHASKCKRAPVSRAGPAVKLSHTTASTSPSRHDRRASYVCVSARNTMSSYWHSIAYFFRLPFHVQWRTALVQLPRWVPLSILHITSPKGPHPFLMSLPSRRGNLIYVYVFVPPKPVDLEGNGDEERKRTGEWHTPVVLDAHGGMFPATYTIVLKQWPPSMRCPC